VRASQARALLHQEVAGYLVYREGQALVVVVPPAGGRISVLDSLEELIRRGPLPYGEGLGEKQAGMIVRSAGCPLSPRIAAHGLDAVLAVQPVHVARRERFEQPGPVRIAAPGSAAVDSFEDVEEKDELLQVLHLQLARVVRVPRMHVQIGSHRAPLPGTSIGSPPVPTGAVFSLFALGEKRISRSLDSGFR